LPVVDAETMLDGAGAVLTAARPAVADGVHGHPDAEVVRLLMTAAISSSRIDMTWVPVIAQGPKVSSCPLRGGDSIMLELLHQQGLLMSASTPSVRCRAFAQSRGSRNAPIDPASCGGATNWPAPSLGLERVRR
jgi:hypothetical protein